MLKVGDIVRIKTWEEMLEDENIYENVSFNTLWDKDHETNFTKEMKQHCGKVITIDEDNLLEYRDDVIWYNTWEFFNWTYTIIGNINELNQTCIIKNRTKVIVEQDKTGQKLSLFSDKTPILSDGDIIKDKEGNVGIVLNNYIRYSKCSTLINTDNISKIYKVKENNTCGYKDILNSFEIDRYCDVIWERLEIEQSLDGLEIGTKVKVKNKLLNITETLTVGRFNSNKVLIRDGLTCYNFNSDKHEILEIIK